MGRATDADGAGHLAKRVAVRTSRLATRDSHDPRPVDKRRATREAQDTTPRFHIGLPPLPDLRIVRPASARITVGMGAAGLRRTFTAFDSAVVTASRDIRGANARQRLLGSDIYRLGIATGDTTVAGDRGLFGLSAKAVDVSFDGQLGLDISTTRQRNLACTPVLAQTPGSGCTGGFTAPSINNTVILQSRGVLFQRFHLNIDLDTHRDYGAANIVSLWYEGQEDEKLKRVDVGTVRFTPPPSRFLSASIPSNNFGISAVAQFGPLEVQGILATQKGSNVVRRTYNIGGTSSSEPKDKFVRDLDYENDRFFWVVDPRTVPGYPAVDILNLDAIAIPTTEQPKEIQVYRYVAANASSGANANYDGVTALGINSGERVGPLRWRRLRANIDYWVSPSGLWFVLSGRIDPNDELAVSYTTVAGTRVGTLPTVDNPSRSDTLQLIYAPNRGPASSLFAYEMRQVYRIDANSLLRNTLRASILLGNSERADSGSGTYLSRLGLAVSTDAAVVDADNRVFPRLRDPGAKEIIRDAILVFPHATPFADPVALSAAERNDSLYRTPEYLLETQGPSTKFRFRFQYDAEGGGDRSGISLGGVRIAEKSEVIESNGLRLKPGIDYTIDYGTGRIDFLDPVGLFGNGSATITAQFEEQGFFAVAPTSIAGMVATLQLSRFGTLSFAGLYQAEQTAFTRPPVGFEPKASLLAGATADLRFGLSGLTRFSDKLVKAPRNAPSELLLNAEIAMSRPDPNRAHAAFLEEFENDGAIQLLANENAWRPGSRPQDPRGLETLGFANGFDLADAVQLIWQNVIPDATNHALKLSPRDIDTTIKLTASRTPVNEPVLYTTLHADTAGGIVDTISRSHWSLPQRDLRPRWRTETYALSPTGVDLSRNDFFEFWLFESDDPTRGRPVERAQMRIVLDLGRVSEDAVSIAPDSFHVNTAGDTIYTGRQYIGRGRLDTEKTPFGTWSAIANDVGILGDRPDSLIGPGGVVIPFPVLCSDTLSSALTIYPWGDLGARCTRGNGASDTEDLDADLQLNAQGDQESVFRYIVDIRDPRYFVRDHAVIDQRGRPARWTLYRVPLRTPDATVGAPDIRLVRQLRLAFVTPPDNGGPDQVVNFALAMMRLTGSSWAHRAERPIAGLAGATAETNGQVVIGSVSTQDVELGYTSPPGVTDASANVTTTQAEFAQQINEKSLRIVATDIHQGQRAEGYNRLPDGSRNLLAYRQMRVWVHGHGTGWDAGPLDAFVKIGSDASNFYLYRAPASTSSWDPEMVIDLETWRALRAEVENRILNKEPPGDPQGCGGDPQSWVACDGGYMVQVHDLFNPPNLASVQELSAGIYYARPGAPIANTELWVDDIRLTQPIAQVGVAAAATAHVTMADIATFDVLGGYQNGQFRQMGQVPTYQDVSTISTSTTMQLGRFFSPKLGLSIPFVFNANWSHSNPELISGSDVEGSGLNGLRRPRSDVRTWSVAVRRIAPATSTLAKFVINAMSLSASGTGGTTVTELSSGTSSAWNATLNYTLITQPRARPLRIGLGGLPRWFRESEAGRGLASGTLTVFPSVVQFTSALSHSMGEFMSFAVPVERLADTILKPVTAEQFLWRNNAGYSWQPIGMLRLRTDWLSTRDLRTYPDSTTLGRLVNASRHSMFGTNVGVERDRSLSNTVNLTPRISSWLHPSVLVGTSFILSRSLTTRNPVRIVGDTAGAYILPQTLNNARYIEYQASVDPQMLSRRIFGDSSSVARALTRFRAIEFSRRRTLESTYDLARFDPGLSYQLALGGLNSFLTHSGQNAIGVSDAVSTSASSSFELLVGITASISYRRTDNDRYQQQANVGFLKTTTQQVDWPMGSADWARTFAKGPFRQVSVGSSFEHSHSFSETPFANGNGARATTDTRRIQPRMALTMSHGILVSLSGAADRSTTDADGNLTRNRSDAITGTGSWNARMPYFFSHSRRIMTTTLTVRRNTSYSCIQRSSDTSCTPFADIARLDVNGSLAAQLRNAITAGASFGWVLNEVKNLQQRTSTLVFSVSFMLPLANLGM